MERATPRFLNTQDASGMVFECFNHIWLVLSDEQMSQGWPFSLLNDEQMSNWLGVQQLPDIWLFKALAIQNPPNSW